MIRVILNHQHKSLSGATYERLETIDLDCEFLEDRLTTGGLSETEHHVVNVVGLEVIEEEEEDVLPKFPLPPMEYTEDPVFE